MTDQAGRRRWRRALAVMIVVSACAASWLAATAFQSPAQREAAQHVPAPRPLVASVESGRLVDSLTIQAEPTYEVSEVVQLTSSGGPPLVVTAVHRPNGEPAGNGDWLLATNDRPVFVLQGEFPLFRDIHHGATGSDVRMVQEALRSSGAEIPDGELATFGRRTQRALEEMYERAGYPIPEPPAELLDEEEALRARVAEDPTDVAATRRLQDLSRSTGAWLSMDEVAIVAALPAVTSDVPPVGSRLGADQPIASLHSGRRRLVATVTDAIAGRVPQGATVTVDLPGQPRAPARVVAIDASPSGAGGPGAIADDAGASMRITIELDSGLPDDVSSPVVVRIERDLVGHETLLVPSSAVVNRGTRSYISVKATDDWREVEVRVLDQLAGRVAIEAIVDDGVESGDEVLIGGA